MPLNNLPPQQLPFSRKTKEWRKKHLDWADSRSFGFDTQVRQTMKNKKINYDLLNGKLDLYDMNMVLNPEAIDADFIPETLIHYPIMNTKLNVLRGEESKRRFDMRVVVTNPEAISEIENNKKNEIFERLKEAIGNKNLSEEEYNAEIEKINDYYSYEWQDLREIRANALVHHYSKELDFLPKFNSGFVNAMSVGEEIYQCDIVSGEPTLEVINPLKIKVYRSGYSNRIEDADIVVLEDFWSPGKIIDTFYDALSQKDMDYIENLPNSTKSDEMDNIDDRDSLIRMDEIFTNSIIDNYSSFVGAESGDYIDQNGNIKVLRVYWKSRRKIKKVKSYDPETGKEEYKFYPETYQCDKSKGEEEKVYWINEAWEGTKIGKEIYINMRPRLVQYNRLSNPSRCHFGIVGTIYNLNDSKPFTLIDMMKPYNYMYNAVHDRLNKAMAANWGKILELDLSLVPKGWEIEKWLHYAKINKIAVKDSFKEGNIGAATGKLAGSMNNASKGVIDAEIGSYIQQHISLLEFIKMEMAEVAGISKQREGQISTRETVGGVERANLQSSHITEWLFLQHDNTKKRAVEVFIETAKIALRGRSKKFQHILSDNSFRLMEIDGDEFAECDYGVLVDNSNGTQDLAAKLDTLAQAALQNQTLSFSTIMKIYTNPSLAETQRLIEKDEQKMQQAKSQEAQSQQEHEMSIAQMTAADKEAERELKDRLNQRDNDYKLHIEELKLSVDDSDVEEDTYDPQKKEELLEKMRQFDAEMQLKREQHNLAVKTQKDNVLLQEKEIQVKKLKPNKTK